MPRKQSKAQKDTVGRVMHKYKHGELRIGRSGPKVENPKQAIAIALSEAGASRTQSPKENRRRLKETKAKERRGATGKQRSEGRGGRSATARTKAELMREAARRKIAGRSRMSKVELERALRRR